MSTLYSYELKGNKQSFANWISNLSPTETPFCSMTPKEGINQTKFFWQTDRLAKAKTHAVIEGSDVAAGEAGMSKTVLVDNNTQILRRAFKISDTANHMANFGRGQELPYQMEKFAVALKRDLEVIFLSEQTKTAAQTNTAGKTACFDALVATKDEADEDTGAIVKFSAGTQAGQTTSVLSVDDIRKMTYNLYLANSEANIIMFHPMHAAFFAALQSHDSNAKMFDGDTTTFSKYVNTYIDEFGREFKLVPNRWMPTDLVYFFKPQDFTQMVLRAPMRTELGKNGNYTSWMLETEVGLRLKDPYAAGVIRLKV